MFAIFSIAIFAIFKSEGRLWEGNRQWSLCLKQTLLKLWRKFYSYGFLFKGMVFIVPRSDHSLRMSLTDSLTNLLTIEWIDPCLVGYSILPWCICCELFRICRICKIWKRCRICRIYRICRLVKAVNAWVRSAFGNSNPINSLILLRGWRGVLPAATTQAQWARWSPNARTREPKFAHSSQDQLKVGNLVRRSGDCHSFQLEPRFTPSYSPRSGQRLRASAFQSPATIPPPFLANSWYIHILLVSKWMKRYPCKLVEVVAH